MFCITDYMKLYYYHIFCGLVINLSFDYAVINNKTVEKYKINI